MQRGEGMAPFAEARGRLAVRRERLDSSFIRKRDRSNDGKGRSSGKAFRDNEGTGSKSRDNDGGHGGNGNGDGSKGDGKGNGDGNGGNGNGNGNNSGSHGGGDSGSPPPGGEGIAGTLPATTAVVVVPAPVTTSSISTTSTFDPGSDSNGAQRLSSDPQAAGVTTTQIPPQTSTIPAPTTVATTSSSSSTSSSIFTSTIAATGPNAAVTSFIPVVTTSAVVESTTTIISIAIGQAGSFGTDFSGFSDLPKPTNKGDANDDSADRKHKGSSTTSNSTSSASEKDTSKPKPLSPTAERALISVGSIGAFVTVCVLFWLVWRAMRKQKQKKNFTQGNISSFDTSDGSFAVVSRFAGRAYGKVASKVPFLGKKGKAWRNLEETSSLTSARNIAPMSMTTNNLGPARVGRAGSPTNMSPIDRADTLQTFGFDNVTINNSNSPPPSMPPQVYYSNGGLGIQFQQDPSQSPPQELDAGDVSPNGASGAVNQSVSSFYSHSPTASRVSATRASAQNMAPAIHLQQIVHTRNSSSISTMTGQPYSLPPMQQPVALRPEQHQLLIQQQLAPSDTSVSSDTMRSRMPDPYYNQSQLARQPSDAYDPERREVNRASELSSLSSGFGDGEMLMLIPEQLNINKTETTNININPGALPQPIAIPAEPMASKGQFSWMRNTKRMTNGTVYSEASDDQPAKFRTVDSWVKQQTGRVRRGQASIDVTTDASAGEAPGVKLMPGHEPGIPHPLPEEQRLTMMMDDEEVPRRPDTLLVNGMDQQVPPIPK